MPRSSRMARLLQAIGLVQLAAVAGWLAWRWPAAPGQAIAGAALVVLVAPIVLAIEFVLLAIVSRDHPGVPAPGALRLAAAWAGETGRLFQVFYWRIPFRWRQPPDWLDPAGAGRQGVVLLHGFVCNRGFWAPWLRRLRAGGHPCVAVNLEPLFTSIDDYVPLVEDAVRKVAACSGLPPVLVCHSMGGLVARAWLRRMQGAGRIRALVTIGSPHGGTWLGRFSSMPNGRQMRMDSAWLRELQQAEQHQPRPPTTCWYSDCDNIVFPVATATLPEADNRLVPGVAHVALAFHPVVLRDTLQALNRSEAALSM